MLMIPSKLPPCPACDMDDYDPSSPFRRPEAYRGTVGHVGCITDEAARNAR